MIRMIITVINYSTIDFLGIWISKSDYIWSGRGVPKWPSQELGIDWDTWSAVYSIPPPGRSSPHPLLGLLWPSRYVSYGKSRGTCKWTRNVYQSLLPVGILTFSSDNRTFSNCLPLPFTFINELSTYRYAQLLVLILRIISYSVWRCESIARPSSNLTLISGYST